MTVNVKTRFVMRSNQLKGLYLIHPWKKNFATQTNGGVINYIEYSNSKLVLGILSENFFNMLMIIKVELKNTHKFQVNIIQNLL